MSWPRQVGGKSRMMMTMIGYSRLTEIRMDLGMSRFYHCSAQPGSSTPNSLLSSAAFRGLISNGQCVPASSSSLLSYNPACVFRRRISSMGLGQKMQKVTAAAFFSYRQAIGLQLEGFLKRNSSVIYGSVGVLLCVLLWKSMFWVANISLGVSEGMAKYGFAAFSSAIVAFMGLYVRSRFVINPNKVYRMAMRKLNTSAGILEVMGAPLIGTDLRAYVMSGGGFTFKNLKPAIRPKRCFLIFPIQGSDRKGLVSVVVKKKSGQYNMKLLAVDIPMGSGADQRFFISGDDQEYNVGGGLIAELRDSLVKTLAAKDEFDDEDQIEEDELSRKNVESQRGH